MFSVHITAQMNICVTTRNYHRKNSSKCGCCKIPTVGGNRTYFTKTRQ